MGFLQDLKSGEDVEKEILAVLQKKFPDARKEVGKFHREFFDIVIPEDGKRPEIKIEVKADLYKSKNLAFECMGRKGKSTGIIKTTSKFWFHYRNGKYLIWETVKLKRYLLDVGKCLRDCGDDKASAAWIIPEEKILAECPPSAIIDRGSDKMNDFILKHI